MFWKKKKEEPAKESKLEKLKKLNALPKGAMVFEVNGNVINITGRSITEDDRQGWIDFLVRLESEIIPAYRTVLINLKVDLFNTSQGQYSTKMMMILSKTNYKCKATVNWYGMGDEETYGYGLIHKENYPGLDINVFENE